MHHTSSYPFQVTLLPCLPFSHFPLFLSLLFPLYPPPSPLHLHLPLAPNPSPLSLSLSYFPFPRSIFHILFPDLPFPHSLISLSHFPFLQFPFPTSLSSFYFTSSFPFCFSFSLPLPLSPSPFSFSFSFSPSPSRYCSSFPTPLQFLPYPIPVKNHESGKKKFSKISFRHEMKKTTIFQGTLLKTCSLTMKYRQQENNIHNRSLGHNQNLE
jgi:hypothetical protein